MIRNSMPIRSLGSASLIELSADIVGELEPCRLEIEFVRFDIIDHRLLVVPAEGIPFAFTVSVSS